MIISEKERIKIKKELAKWKDRVEKYLKGLRDKNE